MDEWAEIASYYDELYVKPDQYKREAAKVLALIDDCKLSGGSDLLDIACGTGGHIPYWRNRCCVTGLDLSPAMLSHAIRKFPDVEFHQGDMVDFALDRCFDAAVCLYGSIGIVLTADRLEKAIARFAAHLKPGGVICLTPWSSQEEFEPKIVVDVVRQTTVRICRMENVKRKALDVVEVELHHLVGRDGTVTYHTRSMEIGLFCRQQYLAAMADAGLEVMQHYVGTDVPMGVFIARKPISP